MLLGLSTILALLTKSERPTKISSLRMRISGISLFSLELYQRLLNITISIIRNNEIGFMGCIKPIPTGKKAWRECFIEGCFCRSKHLFSNNFIWCLNQDFFANERILNCSLSYNVIMKGSNYVSINERIEVRFRWKFVQGWGHFLDSCGGQKQPPFHK